MKYDEQNKDDKNTEKQLRYAGTTIRLMQVKTGQMIGQLGGLTFKRL